MKKYSRFLSGAAALCGILFLFYLVYSDSRKAQDTSANTVIAFTAMSTSIMLDYSGSGSRINAVLAESKKEVLRIEKKFSYFLQDSELYQLNMHAAEKPFKCSDEMWNLLNIAKKNYHITGGAFDPTVRPLMNIWGFRMKRSNIPSEQEIKAAMELTGFDKVVFDFNARTVKFAKKGMSIDLGGIAKGYAADAVAAVAAKHNIKFGIINVGGNIRIIPGNGKKFKIILRDPRSNDKNSGEILELESGSIATSGSSERFSVINGKRYSHIINPLTGFPAEGKLVSATVICSDATTADALSTALFICGKQLADELNLNCRLIERDK